MSVSLDMLVNNWLDEFFTNIKLRKHARIGEMFAQKACWRDIVSFTWNIITVSGRRNIVDMVKVTSGWVEVFDWKIVGEIVTEDNLISCWFVFTTSVAQCKGKLSLIDGKCTVFFTVIEELVGHEEPIFARRAVGHVNKAIKGRKTWFEISKEEKSCLGYEVQPYVVIVGGGQGGIALAARLKMMNVPTIVVDKNLKPGDSWRNRYESLYLRNTLWQNHLPYLEFPDNWPVYMSKDQMADWLEMYVKVMDLNYWSSTVCVGATYLPDLQKWNITVNREGNTIQINPKHLVIATGLSGLPRIPEVEGSQLFKGVICHSSDFQSGKKFNNKKCVVVGSNNSAHDICMDLWENGADVTMLQRSETLVVRAETFFSRSKYTQKKADIGLTTNELDVEGAAIPYQVMREQMISEWSEIAKNDSDYYSRLVDAGFLVTFGQDGSGLEMMYMYRGSGYYIDVGATELIVNGDIKLNSGVTVDKICQEGIILSDGTSMNADLIVYATGYQSMNSWVEKLISKDIASKVGRCWGLGSGTKYDPGPWEGELRNMWKPTSQDGLWFHGGGLTQSRLYSRYLAIQLKARLENISTQFYGVHGAINI
ncbi:MAG TPA: FAD-dependent oxidoreductase [Chloroflexi bacterium]|nr:FAD-dependent oxidoreductase [Chloroflexota bacterium]|tara:strand:+ start:200 stop:1981 length:1782 start_codon:yes stop_codon:yes gene_type:complete